MMSTTENPELKICFLVLNYKIFQVFWGFEQLSSSIVWRVVAFSQNYLCDFFFNQPNEAKPNDRL